MHYRLPPSFVTSTAHVYLYETAGQSKTHDGLLELPQLALTGATPGPIIKEQIRVLE
jgi:hypothetical protein